MPAPGAARAQVQRLHPADDAWLLEGEAEVRSHAGEPVLALRSGRALRPDLRFSDGTIEFEMLPTDRRAFLGVVFRATRGGTPEDIYLRLHKSLLPDAVQYSPDFGGRGQWQLYHGPSATAAARFAADAWQPVRIEVRGSRAAVFVGEEAREPRLVVDRLRSGSTEGAIGFWGNQPGAEGDDPPSALLRNIVIRHGSTTYSFPPPPPEPPVPWIVQRWGVSAPFVRGGDDVLTLPPEVLNGVWRSLTAEPSGLLPLDRDLIRPGEGVPAVLVGLRIHAESERTLRLDVGFSDDLSAFLDGQLIYSGRNGFSTNFPRRQGLITLDQASLHLPLHAGENLLILAVSEVYGGWGVMGRIEDREGLTIEPLDAAPARGAGIEFRNGRWFDGSGFSDRVFYAVEGLLTGTPPETVTRVIDLEGGFVIPPFGEAHNHRPDGWPGTEHHVDQFIEHGIFYVLNPNSFPSMTRAIEGDVNRPESIDVAFANGGLTPPGSHVVALYERNLARGTFPEGWTRERLDGEGFVVIRDAGDVEARWPAVLAGEPDFVKVFLGFSEDHETRRDDPEFFGKRGIDPDLVPDIVERAHSAGLRVAAHIETAEDFRIAVAAEVDLIVHMPGSWRIGAAAGYPEGTLERWLLDDEDVAAAARRGVAVVAHVHGAFQDADMARIHGHNLSLLKRHGVPLAIGSDNYRQTSLVDALYLQSTGLFSPLEVLRIASVATPRAIFPGRRIGRLEEGYEASFLVLVGNPIASPLFALPEGGLGEPLQGVTQRIRLRVKQGRILDAASENRAREAATSGAAPGLPAGGARR